MDGPPDRRSAADRAYDCLRTEILHGELMPGARLRANELQDRFQLGLTPIREALTRLATEGLVDSETHRGSRVIEASLAGFADLMTTRRAIERLCLERAIALGDADWEGEIVASLHMLSRAPLPASEDDRAAASLWEERHRRFHAALVAACGSEWLLRFWGTLADHSARYRKLRLLHHRQTRAEVRDVNKEHAAIMEAVLARDAPTACALLDAHLQATQTSVLTLLQDGRGPAEETAR